MFQIAARRAGTAGALVLLLGSTVFLAFGVVLIGFSRSISRWMRNEALRVRSAEEILSIRAYNIVTIGVGFVSATLGVLLVAGLGRSKS